MNLSSLVVYARENKANDVVAALDQSDFCKVHTFEDEKIIITMEAEDASEEMQKIRQVEAVSGVLGAYVAYTYCEEELDRERDKMLQHGEYPPWLNDDSLKAEHIPYSGKIKF